MAMIPWRRGKPKQAAWHIACAVGDFNAATPTAHRLRKLPAARPLVTTEPCDHAQDHAGPMNDIATRKPATRLKRITPLKRPTRAEAEAAVRTLIAWAGDDPTREG